MPYIGPYHVPFPFEPYELQVHAVTELRSFLSKNEGVGRVRSPPNANAIREGAPSVPIAVLESPTGTGKSHMLLNGLLSHLFEVTSSTSLDDLTHEGPANITSAAPSPQGEPLRKAVRMECHRGGSLESSSSVLATNAGGIPSAQATLEDIVRQRQVEEAQREFREARHVHIRKERRRLHRIRKQRATWRRDDCIDNVLIEQDGTELLKQDCGGVSGATSTACPERLPSLYHCSSSSSSSRASSCGREGEGTTEDAAGVEGGLAGRLPLRKPKLYFASRTHTQLEQVMDDLRQTEFGRFFVVPRRHNGVGEGETPTCEDVPGSSRGSGRPLSAVHVAGRQHLCINAALRRKAGNRAEALSELCLAAMQFEYSPAGVAARLAMEKQRAGTVAVTTDFARSPPRDIEDTLDVPWPASEGPTVGGGCEYCAKHRLESFLAQVSDIREEGVASSHTPYTAMNGKSLHEMILMGQQMRACPYLVSRLLVRSADVVFVPYGYLLDENQRNALLGGAATNPVTEAELEAQAHYVDAGEVERKVPYTVGSVMYRHRHRHDCCMRGRQPTHDSAQAGPVGRSAAVPHVGALPCFSGDLLAIDEAHNVSDHCRQLSTAGVSSQEIELVQQMIQMYIARYESRLLTSNKQRLREMNLLLKQIRCYAERAAVSSRDAGHLEDSTNQLRRPTVPVSASSTLSSASEAVVPTSRVVPFTTVLFDAGVDHVDVVPLLVFIATSHLFVKLSHMLPYILSLVAKEGEKRGCSSDVKVGEGSALALLVHLQMMSETHAVGGVPPTTAWITSLASSAEAQRRVNSRITLALQRVEAFLRWFAQSGSSTRVLLTAVLPTAVERVERAAEGSASRNRTLEGQFVNRGAVSFTEDADTTERCPSVTVELKLVQLEPGQHTIYPLLQQVQATVLAGGTMQPLALSCGPLLPPPCAPEGGDRIRMDGVGKACSGGSGALYRSALPVKLISEGHVVPATSMVVYALGVGPSGRRMEFSSKALASRSSLLPTPRPSKAGDVTHSRSPASRSSGADTVSGHAEEHIFTELASTLLNLARVLPPAGVVCFFPSYELEERVTAFLHRTGTYEELNAVKRIFRDRRTVAGHAATAGMDTKEDVMAAYRAWVEGQPLPAAVSGDGAKFSRGSDVVEDVGSPCGTGPEGRRKTRGALLFAVMGGRFSEGINFANDLGRAVVVVGLPFANLSDTELQLYLQHIAHTRVCGGDTVILSPADALKGSAVDVGASSNSTSVATATWSLYTDLCMRTVNQSIGRCIRHAGDYAAVVLIDARYAERAELRQRIPAWMQRSLKVSAGFGECFRGLRVFFEQR